MTHRTGRSWRVTIVDEQPDGDRLHAVVMAGRVLTTDADLAERVCALLNAWGDGTTAGGARCTKCGTLLAPCWRCGRPSQCGEMWCDGCAPGADGPQPVKPATEPVSQADLAGILDSRARAVSVRLADEEAAPDTPSAPVAAERGAVQGAVRMEAAEAPTEADRYPPGGCILPDKTRCKLPRATCCDHGRAIRWPETDLGQRVQEHAEDAQ